MKKKTAAAVLASGGVDSAVLLAWAAQRHSKVYPLFIRAGHPWEKAELYWLKRYLRALKARNLKPLTVLESPSHNLAQPAWAKGKGRAPGRQSQDSAVYLP